MSERERQTDSGRECLRKVEHLPGQGTTGLRACGFSPSWNLQWVGKHRPEGLRLLSRLGHLPGQGFRGLRAHGWARGGPPPRAGDHRPEGLPQSGQGITGLRACGFCPGAPQAWGLAAFARGGLPLRAGHHRPGGPCFVPGVGYLSGQGTTGLGARALCPGWASSLPCRHRRSWRAAEPYSSAPPPPQTPREASSLPCRHRRSWRAAEHYFRPPGMPVVCPAVTAGVGEQQSITSGPPECQ
ncbi:hypothetical protein RRG08_028184 [Elysia crispata]|uniref:Uncharacterized protein n=1 Tax=Elysia crispata TaxID=231223 RepID=A0AAE1B7E8_9GAST|nr:hypothetical protein RRG08_028184 [Elysia crispata]